MIIIRFLYGKKNHIAARGELGLLEFLISKPALPPCGTCGSGVTGKLPRLQLMLTHCHMTESLG